MFTIKDVEKLAELSRISISEEEKEAVRGEIESILRYISDIQKLKGDVASSHERSTKNVMREDVQAHGSGAYSEDLLSQAPKTENGYVVVKKILNQN